jgi:hypothetical protein
MHEAGAKSITGRRHAELPHSLRIGLNHYPGWRGSRAKLGVTPDREEKEKTKTTTALALVYLSQISQSCM